VSAADEESGRLMEELLEGYAAQPTAEESLADAAASGVLRTGPGSGNAAFAAAGGPAISALAATPGGAGSAAQQVWAVTKPLNESQLRAAEAGFTPVHRWPFTLDTFQRQAVVVMEQEGPSAAVFVAAHTSAGKTLVAEYAMSLAIAHRSKCVYTSPIKALSNQKYHDLRKVFGGSDGKGVGIITGDVSLNPDAPVVIMTTEILRSMLYRGDAMIQEIEWAVFDEIHYM
jgi:antiviral helicase SKI2